MKLRSKALKFCFSFLLIATALFSQTRVVTLPGSIQGALGGADWDVAGEITKMTSTDDNSYTFTGVFPKGDYEYKVAVGGTWDENYGIGGEAGGKNIKLSVPADNSKVTFTFNYTTKTITDSINGEVKKVAEVPKPVIKEGEGLKVTLPGTIQSALGGKDWETDGKTTVMKYMGDDIYELHVVLPKGNYDYKVAIGGDWSENYGVKGQKDGSNITFIVPKDNSEVTFIFNYKTKESRQEFEIEGFNYIPILTNKFEQKGEDKPITVTNEFELGILSKNLNMKSKFSYNFDYDKDSDKQFTSKGNELALKNAKIEELAVDYTFKGFTTGLMVNTSNFKNSNDYFGVLETSQENSKRKYGTIQIKEIADNNYGARFVTNKFAKISIEAAKYIPDLYEDAATEKSLALINIEKEMLNKKLLLGTSNVFYQVAHDGVNEDLLINGTVYGKFNVTKKLQVKGEVGYIPTGSILETKVRTGTFKQANGNWKFVFDPTEKKATKNTTIKPIGEVHLVGEMTTWNAADKSYPLVKQADGTWVAEFAVPDDNRYKFIYDADTWNGNESTDDLYVKETVTKGEGLNHGINLYMAEINYNLWDKGNFQVGTKVMDKGLYMPFAKDDLMYNNTTGSAEYYLNADFKVTKNAKLYLEQLYKTEENKDNMLSEKTKVGFDIANIPMMEYVKGYYEQDPYTMQNPDYNATDRKDAFRTDVKDAFLEAKLNKLPLVKFLKLNTTQRFESETSQYYAETELKTYGKLVEYIKGNMTYALDKVHYNSQDDKAFQYWGEIKLHNLPLVKNFISYVKASYESDNNGDKGIVENRYYNNKDDNDWIKKFNIETKLQVTELKKWDGLTVKYEMRQIEASKTKDTPSDLTKDGQYYVAAARTFVDWYSILDLSTEFKIPFGIKTKVTYKYDLTHEKRSEFENDGIRVELEKKIGLTTINASYNTKDTDNGRDYTKVVFKTVF